MASGRVRGLRGGSSARVLPQLLAKVQRSSLKLRSAVATAACSLAAARMDFLSDEEMWTGSVVDVFVCGLAFCFFGLLRSVAVPPALHGACECLPQSASCIVAVVCCKRGWKRCWNEILERGGIGDLIGSLDGVVLRVLCWWVLVVSGFGYEEGKKT